jgi:hypothetical protein
MSRWQIERAPVLESEHRTPALKRSSAMDKREECAAVSAHDYSVIKGAFKAMVAEGLPEHVWAEVAERMVGDLTRSIDIDPELVMRIIRR